MLVGGSLYYDINGLERFGYAEYLLPTSTNGAPAIEASVQSAPIQGIISIYLADIGTDAEDNIDFSTAIILSPPTSGVTAYIEDGYLIIDYGQTPFSGTEHLTLRICDTEGACTEQEITIDMAGDITVYNAISPNNDGLNDIFYIQYINLVSETQKNKVTIYNRWGNNVFEVEDYNNDTNVFKGLNQNGGELPSGTYFYKIEYTNSQPTKTGYIVIKR
ncbi:MAG: gliding motility-associated C-terminal domain-containing protein [Cytophagales bacterium]|nr:gliding motility-associated C-terminal domain-containing protein [Cytophagales bacterium]